MSSAPRDTSETTFTVRQLPGSALVTGPARVRPEPILVDRKLPRRYDLKTPWDTVRPEQKLPLINRASMR